jgi:hypothetical protein
VFVSTEALDRSDIAFFSGFVAGDGSFLIRPNNAGTSWVCALAVTLRADDTPLLAEFRDWSGAGDLYRASVQGRSRPQTSWTVGRRADCMKIAAILGQSPPLGKAALVFELWRRAVQIWSAEGGASPALAELAAELRDLRNRRVSAPCPVDISTERLRAFFSGFASAEAHFGVNPGGHPFCTINLRADDAALLALFRDAFGLGYLRDVPARGTSRQAVSWRVGRLTALRELVHVLDAYPPRGRAGNVYRPWRELILTQVRTPTVKRAFAVYIGCRRRFVPGLDRFETPAAHLRRVDRCAEALRAWAASGDYPGSSGNYERWRKRVSKSWPTRNTIAAAYGSWLAALEANGLDTSRSMPRERVDAIRDGSAGTREARRHLARREAIAVVRRCIAALGHEPGAMEFLRWRAANAPESASQMTLYRLFPGGFGQVLELARSRPRSTTSGTSRSR